MLRRKFIGIAAALFLFPYELFKAKAAPKTRQFFPDELLNKCFGKSYDIRGLINQFLARHYDLYKKCPRTITISSADFQSLSGYGGVGRPPVMVWNFYGSTVQVRPNISQELGTVRWALNSLEVFRKAPLRKTERPGMLLSLEGVDGWGYIP